MSMANEFSVRLYSIYNKKLKTAESRAAWPACVEYIFKSKLGKQTTASHSQH